MEIILIESNKIGQVQDGIRGKVMDSKLVEIKNLTEEKIAGGSEAVEEMLMENNDFPGSRRRFDFIAGGALGNAGRDEPGLFVALECLLGQQRSAPIGGDGSLGCGSSGRSSGGNVNH